MKKFRRKFPANFSDLLFIAWCVKDMGDLMTQVFIWEHSAPPSFIGIFVICIKFSLGLGSAEFRIRYNRRRDG